MSNQIAAGKFHKKQLEDSIMTSPEDLDLSS
jgi:hypothetical protein